MSTAVSIRLPEGLAKDLARLGKAEAKQVLDKIEKELTTHPDRYPTLKGPFAGMRKMRMGDYRIIYVVLDKDVVILRVGNRREIHKQDNQGR